MWKKWTENPETSENQKDYGVNEKILVWDQPKGRGIQGKDLQRQMFLSEDQKEE